MKPSRVSSLLVASAVALSGLLFAAPAEAAAVKTGVVVQFGMGTVKVRPTAITPFKDLRYTGVRWTRLTRSVGYATAVRHVNTCLPSCAHANIRKTRVKLRFTRVLPFNGRPVFTRVTVTEIRSGRTATHRLPEGIDWSRATLDLPRDTGASGCPTGRVTLRNGKAVLGRKKISLLGVKAYGELTRDGRTDTVLHVHCESAVGVVSGDGSGNLLVATQRGDDAGHGGRPKLAAPRSPDPGCGQGRGQHAVQRGRA